MVNEIATQTEHGNCPVSLPRQEKMVKTAEMLDTETHVLVESVASSLWQADGDEVTEAPVNDIKDMPAIVAAQTLVKAEYVPLKKEVSHG